MTTSLALFDPRDGERMRVVLLKNRLTGQSAKPKPFFLIRESDLISGASTNNLIDIDNYPELLPKIDEAVRRYDPNNPDSTFIVVWFDPI